MIKKKIGTMLVIVFLSLFCMVNLFPFINILLNSFRLHEDIIRQPLSLDFSKYVFLYNYIFANKHADIFRSVFNGVLASFLTIISAVLLGTISAYALTFIKIKYSGVVMTFLVAGYFIPPGALTINAFLFLKDLHLLNSFAGLTLVFVSVNIPITLILLTGYMKTIPISIIEAAKVDGANHFVIFRRIVLPMCKPILVTLIILLFLWTYRDYMWPLTIMSRPAKRTIAVALSTFVGDRQLELGAMNAAVVISIIPIITAFIVLKDKIMSGMAAGAIKE